MKNKKGFTLAEILITLTVIGIIAAITINIINTNVKEAEIVAKLKKTVGTLSAAMYRASVDYGSPNNWVSVSSDSKNRITSKVFMNKYIVPYLLKIKEPTDATLSELGYKNGIRNKNNSYFYSLENTTQPVTRVFFNDGTTILALQHLIDQEGYVEYIYVVDINGPKGPNIAGKDVFEIGIDVRTEAPIVKMYGLHKTIRLGNNVTEIIARPESELLNECANNGSYCGALIQKNGWKIPQDYPVKI